jgi:hypothetical protein
MKYRHQNFLTLLTALSLPWTSCLLALAADTDPQARQQVLQGQLSADGIMSDDIQSKLGFKCETNDKQQTVVTTLTPDSQAAQSGMLVGDVITDVQSDDQVLDIGVTRDKQQLRFRLSEVAYSGPPAHLVALQAKMDAKKPYALGAEQRVNKQDLLKAETNAKTDKNLKSANISNNRFNLSASRTSLADYRVELLIDRSQSMRTQDCPNGQTRWNWIGAQAASLASSIAPLVPNGLTIVPFATEYDVFEHATARNINNIFADVKLQYGTRLYEPLAERLDRYFMHRQPDGKPLLIVVVTDGLPSPKFEPEMVRNELVAASRRMNSPNDVTVVFCQIGDDDPKGAAYLSSLDTDLTSAGARYHFVHTISFSQLASAGLAPTLTGAIKQYGSTKSNTQLATRLPAPGIPGPRPTSGRSDKFVDGPNRAPDGGRHYGNGRFFDLTRVPVDQAAAVCNEYNREAYRDMFYGGKRQRGKGQHGNHQHQGNQWARTQNDSLQ